jgi:2-polyprenyl-3-methyl-5-hydroxy-6-metoxy-1,4-benzoquinol methylase
MMLDSSNLNAANKPYPRFLSPNPSSILDIGGGTGIYSFWLKSLGHSVHLIDAAESNIQAATAEEINSGIKLDLLQIADAPQLPFPDEHFDLVLSMGPLYHLQERNDRIQSLKEAKGVLKKNGHLIVATISRFASVLDGSNRNLVSDPDFVSIMQNDIINGKHQNHTSKLDYFTTSYFYHPDEIKSECEEVGLKFISTLQVESFGWMIPEFEKKWSDKNFRELLLNTIQKVESEKNLIGMSAHLLTVCSK